jgi:hypothetical protein
MRALRIALLFLLGACHMHDLREETAALSLGPESMAQRQMQIRRFDTRDEAGILSATAALLQDLGFTIEESAARNGFVVGSKDRETAAPGQSADQKLLAALFGMPGGVQTIRASIVTKPSANAAAVVVRVTFQRVVWSKQNQMPSLETIGEPLIYQRFFDRLSQAVFLEAHQI